MATKCFGILTAGGDCPGLNAAIRGVGRPLMDVYQAEFIGFRDGFRGLIENRVTRFADGSLSGILTIGGTILGTSRDKLHRMPVGGEERDMTDVAVENYQKQADVILIPEIPFSVETVANALIHRDRKGKRFSIVAMAEGANPKPGLKEDKGRKRAGKRKSPRRLPLTLARIHSTWLSSGEKIAPGWRINSRI